MVNSKKRKNIYVFCTLSLNLWNSKKTQNNHSTQIDMNIITGDYIIFMNIIKDISLLMMAMNIIKGLCFCLLHFINCQLSYLLIWSIPTTSNFVPY